MHLDLQPLCLRAQDLANRSTELWRGHNIATVIEKPYKTSICLASETCDAVADLCWELQQRGLRVILFNAISMLVL